MYRPFAVDMYRPFAVDMCQLVAVETFQPFAVGGYQPVVLVVKYTHLCSGLYCRHLLVEEFHLQKIRLKYSAYMTFIYIIRQSFFE